MKERAVDKETSLIQLLVVVILLVFFSEVLTSIILMTLPPVPNRSDKILGGLLDTALISPTIYFILIRPLINQIERRKRAEAVLHSTLGDLENRVQERTAELLNSNELLTQEIEAGQKVKAILEKERSELENRINERTQELRDEVQRSHEAASRLHLQTTALEAAGNGVFITNRQGIVEWANQAFYTMTGYSPEELIGKTPRLIKSGLYGEQFYTYFWNTILAGNIWRGEIANRRKDGTLYIEEQTVAPVLDENNAVTHFIAIKQDITDRKRAEEVIHAEATRAEIRARIEEALSEASPSFKTVLDVTVKQLANLIGDICFIHLVEDHGGKIILAACHAAGSDPDTPESNHLIETAVTIGATIAQMALSSGQQLSLSDLNFDKQPGANYYAQIKMELDICAMLVIPIVNQGQALGTLSLLRNCSNSPFSAFDQSIVADLTERVSLAISHSRLFQDLEKSLHQEKTMRAMLVQTEKFAAIGRMVASVAHELNNPLQTIKNCLYLLEPDLSHSPSQEFLILASSEVQRLANLVEQLREVYRPQSDNQLNTVDIVKVLEDVRQIIFSHLQRNQVKWEFTPSTRPVIAMGVSDQLKQVFLNICLNAIEAMAPAGGAIKIYFEESNEFKTGIVIQDNGPGIEPEHISHVFEPLYTTKEKGLGLGLSISYDIVQKHGGEISVVSSGDLGTKFTVWLPHMELLPPTST